jgi:hypothetical protein
MTNHQIQIDELEAEANEKELIANLSTSEKVKTKNMQLARALRERAALLQADETPVEARPVSTSAMSPRGDAR